MGGAERPIGFFDSGLGGLTVLREVARLLPSEHLIYLGDTAHLPYGDKSPETILQLSLENASFLLEKGIKLLMIPCHTACSHALEVLQKKLPIPVIGVIDPGLALLRGFQRIAILGTVSTIESGVYPALIRKENPEMKIYAQACPLFVPLIEEGFWDHPATDLIARSYLEPLKGKVDAVLLACTHYPLIRQTIQRVLGSEVILLEPAALSAKKALDYLGTAQLLRTGAPCSEFYVTDDPEKFRRLGKLFFGAEIERVEKK